MLAIATQGRIDVTYALAGLEMNLQIVKRPGQLHGLSKWWRGNSGGTCARQTRPEICLETVERLTISRILT